MHFWESASPLLDELGDAVMIFQKGELVYANPPARALVGPKTEPEKIFSEPLPNAGVVECVAGGVPGRAYTGFAPGEEALLVRFVTDEQENDPLKVLLGSVSGELRESMSIISMAVELLMPQIENSGDPKLSTYISMLHHHQRRIQRIAGNIGSFCELADGSMSLDFSKFDLVELCAGLIDQVAGLWDNRERRISFRTELPALYTMGDVEKLKRMLLNLISNSMKFTAPNGEISLTLSVSGERIQLIVADNGVGMDSETLSRVFSSFNSAAPPSAESGAGIGVGLPIASGIARLHGGALMLESKPGVGTRVTVTMKKWPERELGLQEEVLVYGPTANRVLLTELADALSYVEYSPKTFD